MKIPLSVKILFKLFSLTDKSGLSDKLTLEKGFDVVLCYHDVSEADWEFSVTPKAFENQIKFLKENFRLVPLKEMLRKSGKPGTGRIAITFDDGLKSVYRDAFPVLKKYGVKATVFLIENKLIKKPEKAYMTVGEIKKLIKSGWEIGSHTRYHQDLTLIPVMGLSKETGVKIDLEKKLGVKVPYFAYPHGKFNGNAVKAASKSGYSYSFTTSGSLIKVPAKNKHTLGRIIISKFFEKPDFEALFSPINLRLNNILTTLWMIKDYALDITKSQINRILRNLKLLYLNPVAFIYSFKTPDDKFIKIEEFDTNTEKVGKNIEKKLRRYFPELKPIFHGSSSLGLPGQNDIDIIMGCDPNQFNKYLPRFKKILGKPSRIHRRFIEWHFKEKGFDIEVSVMNPESIVYKEILGTNLILKKDKKLRSEYKEFKLFINGASLREYERAKTFFYETKTTTTVLPKLYI